MNAARVRRRGTLLGSLVCALLLSGALWGIVYGTRAGMAQALYGGTKFGSGPQPVARVLKRAQKAHGLYPFNYRFCSFAAAGAFAEAGKASSGKAGVSLAAAEHWCETGLSLNPYHTPLRLLEVKLLEVASPARAAEAMRRYVDWDFWDPFYHAELVRLYAAAGDFALAADELEWVEGSPHYDLAVKALNRAWQEEQRAPR